MANQFSARHIGITERDLPKMLETVGVKSVDELIDQTIPAIFRLDKNENSNSNTSRKPSDKGFVNAFLELAKVIIILDTDFN